MKGSFSFLAMCFLLACSSGPSGQTPVDSTAAIDEEAIRDLMNRYVSGYESEDVETFVSVFAEDAVRMQPNGPAIVGSDQIRAYYENWFTESSLDVVVTPDQIELLGDRAVAWGTYTAKVTSKTDGTESQDRGKWINVFVKGTDGGWRFYRNIWNSDLPLSDDEP